MSERSPESGAAEDRVQRAVLLVDVTGSTQLYETVGDSAAVRQIGQCLDWMRIAIEAQRGHFVGSKGDDVLATFELAAPALSAVENILVGLPWVDLSVHAGLHFGPVVPTRNDIFGDAVNLTARLASIANPGEVLISGEFVERLDFDRSVALRPMNTIAVKGKSRPIEIYSLSSETVTRQTALIPPAEAHGLVMRVHLDYGDIRFSLEEGSSISVGRSPECDLIIPSPWVSRKHATFAINHGRAQLTDHSSYGCYLSVDGSVEVVARRETVVVMGSGTLSPGISIANPHAQVISIEIELAG